MHMYQNVTFVCMYVCMCVYVCMHEMYVCMYVYACMYVSVCGGMQIQYARAQFICSSVGLNASITKASGLAGA